MAVTLKRKRGAVSYKEPSSDEDVTESSDHGRQIRRKSAPARRSTRQRQQDNEDSSRHTTPEPAAPVRTFQQASRSTRGRQRGRQMISYKDVSSDEEDLDADFELEEAERVVVVRTRPRTSAVQSPQPRKTCGSKGRPRHRSTLGAVLKPSTEGKTERKTVEIPTDGQKPDWSTLPYHVLLQVFVYASHPLHDENMKPTISIGWLVQMARTCSAFTKPALTALYRNPPIFALRQSRKDLVYHLTTLPAEGKTDCRVMVKRLELDATQMTSLTDAANSVSDLAALVKSLPTLREIDVFDPVDRPPFRDRLPRLRRWVYPSELFEALRQTQLRIRSWRWNSTFCGQGPLWMKEIHSDAVFQSLREVTLTKFHPDPSREDREDGEDIQGPPTVEELLASALSVLPNLRALTFETCGVVSGRLLPLLPNNLISLSIINCGELLSDALQAFLTSHGTHLEELILNHNQSLNLSFLVGLKHSCPKLEVLRMDTTYYSSLAMSSDNEPLYETLLGEDEMPSWPSSMRVIDMEYLRKWDAASATNFFSSLIDAAEDLPWLQEITILTMVDTDWRQRAEFRMKWSAKFKRVFARKWESPSPHLASLRAFREWKEQPSEQEKIDSMIEVIQDELLDHVHDAEVVNDSDSDAPLISTRAQKADDSWGSKRLRSRSKVATIYDEASDAESADESKVEVPSDEEDATFVQGRCHTVIFRIDNFRPREEIYAEADFLDAEPSGDEEWNGNEVNEDEGGYAW